MRERRRFIAAISTAACTLVLAVSMTTTSAQAVQSGPTSPCQSETTPAPVTSTSVPLSSKVAGAKGTVKQRLIAAPHTAAKQVLPSATWKPADASAAELQYFHIPARPASGTALTAWKNEWVHHFSGFGTVDVCGPTAAKASISSGNWGGLITKSGPVTEVYGSTVYKAGSSCAVQPDSYTNWVGIGGSNSQRLIQNGFFNAHSLGSFPFYELLNGTTDTSATRVSLGGTVNLGDRFNISTSYDVDNALFGWHDLTTGVVYQLYVSQALGHAASFYYDGSTGEAIDERGTLSGQLTSLRNYGTSAWSQVQVAQNFGSLVPIRGTASHTGIDLVSGGTTYSTLTAGSDAAGFTDNWKTCGHTGT